MTRARLAVFFFAAIAAQWALSTYGAFGGISPHLFLALTVVLAGREGAVCAMVLGFGWGLGMDFMNAHLFGANALLLTLAGYGAGSVRRQIDIVSMGAQCFLIYFFTQAYFLLFGLLGLAFAKSFIWVGWPAFLCDPLYNCVVAVAADVLFPAPRGFAPL